MVSKSKKIYFLYIKTLIPRKFTSIHYSTPTYFMYRLYLVRRNAIMNNGGNLVVLDVICSMSVHCIIRNNNTN
jgi:hypothetical protein